MALTDCPYNPPCIFCVHDQCKAELAAVARALGASPGEDLAHLVALKVQEKRDALVSRDASRERAAKAEGRLAQAQAVVSAARAWHAARSSPDMWDVARVTLADAALMAAVEAAR